MPIENEVSSGSTITYRPARVDELGRSAGRLFLGGYFDKSR